MKSSAKKPPNSRQLALLIAKAALDKKAGDLLVMDLRGLADFCDFFIICHGQSDVHARAISNHIAESLQELSIRPQHTEGEDAGRWILLDFTDVVCHVFQESIRRFYALERLWGDAPLVKVPGYKPGLQSAALSQALISKA